MASKEDLQMHVAIGRRYFLEARLGYIKAMALAGASVEEVASCVGLQDMGQVKLLMMTAMDQE